MPFSGGSFSLYTPGNPVVTNTTISSSWANNTLSDIATGLSTCVLKDGTQTITANIPMSGYKLTGLAAGTSNGDSVRYEQVVGAYLPITGGTLTGNLLFTDATYDIGASGATRPRDLYLSRNAVIGGTLNVTGHPTLEGVTATGATGTGNMVFATSPTLSSPVLNTAVTGTAIADASAMAAMTATNLIVTPNANKIILGTEQSGSSTSIDFTSIPAGVRRITINVVGLSSNGTDNFLVQLGDSGGFENTGYTSACNAVGTSTITSSAGFLITPSDVQAAAAYHGRIVLTLEDSSDHTWVSTAQLYSSGGASTMPNSVGTKSLSAELTQVRITTSGGTNSFDAGVVNILFER